MSTYQILLYYKYVSIADPEKVREEMRAVCEQFGLKGRIIIAQEGINGTVEGTTECTEKYIAWMNSQTVFRNINFKKSKGTGTAFPKLKVKVRPEIVTSNVPGLNPLQVTGNYLSADELHTWYQSGKEFYVVDMRNDFEYASGHFEGFVGSGMKNFYTLGEVASRLDHLKNKSIVTVCTGGIRCEKASGYLLMNGFTDVYQLKDGIATYMEKYPGGYFKGKLYVFDNRLTMGFGDRSEIVGKCDHCGVTCESYVNCEYNVCHRHYICCNDCLDKETGLAFCNTVCKAEYFHASGVSTQPTV